MKNIASVIISNPSREVDREFEYKVPDNLLDFIEEGSKVVVPFGKYNNYKDGYVVEIKENSDYDINKLKNIVDLADESISINNDLLNLSKYMRKKYLCTFSDALKVMTPPRTSVKEIIKIKFIKNEEDITSKQRKILNIIEKETVTTLDKLNKHEKTKKIDLLELEKKGCIFIEKEFTQGIKKKEIEVYFLGEKSNIENFINNKSIRAKKQREVIEKILINNEENLKITEIMEKYKCTREVIKGLIEKKLLVPETKEVYRNPITKDYEYNKLPLTDDQKNAIQNIIDNFKYGNRKTLLHGVTGCGKTEIYLNLVEKFINEDYGCIVLVPEISLTPQTVERFRGRFGEKVAVIHSKLSDGERYDQWRKIKNGEYKIVVGARSAVFAPVNDLKLIIIDEEHEYSYKSESNPRYFTHDIAEYRIEKSKGLMILGSATPRIESYYKSQIGEYNLVTINKRVKNIPMPNVEVVDMKEEIKFGNRTMFSNKLFKGLEENINENKQSILFLNRRGYSTFVSCRSCGHVCECESCDISLTYHHGSSILKCHQCGREYPIPTLCPKCKSKYIKYFGVGTEKVQKEVEKYFKCAKPIRMDVDTTSKKGAHEKIYNLFKEKKRNILIGTQMISKGMDFKDVTLVGVISADLTLNIPNFRSSERTFQLLTQVSGRAGRGENLGNVIIQTYDPEHFSIQCAKNHDYTSFYKKEIIYRKQMNNPPFSDIIQIVFSCDNLGILEKNIRNFSNEIKYISQRENVAILGPAPCYIFKLKDKYRYHIIFKGEVDSIKGEILNLLNKNLQNKDINFSIDINPYTLA